MYYSVWWDSFADHPANKRARDIPRRPTGTLNIRLTNSMVVNAAQRFNCAKSGQ